MSEKKTKPGSLLAKEATGGEIACGYLEFRAKPRLGTKAALWALRQKSN